MRFRFKIRRTRVDDCEIEIESTDFNRATVLATQFADGTKARGVTVRKQFEEDPDPALRMDVIGGKDVGA